MPNTLEHGGDIGAARRRYPQAPEPWIDLSTGINPVPYAIPVLFSESWSRLPTKEQEQALLAAAARRYGLRDLSTIVAAPGTQALIQLLPRLVPKSRVVVLGPTYEEHAHCWTRQGHEVSDDGEADVTIVVNPNNPTGRLLSPDTLRQTRGLLIVDEAFIDLFPSEASLAGDLPPNTIVLRSFGKTYGLAGARLGFAIAEKKIADRIRGELGPWAVSGPALDIGRFALGDDAWLEATRTRLAADQERLDAILVAAGLAILGGTTLFRLARHDDAPALIEKLGSAGIHVRSFAKEPTWLRFGMPAGEAGFRRLAAALSRAGASRPNS